MIRIDRTRLQNAVLPIRIKLGTRFADLDFQGHVNNVAFAGLFQEASNHCNTANIRPHLPPGVNILVGTLCVDYVGELHHPSIVEISTGVLEIGRSSYVIGHRMQQDDRIAAFCEVSFILGGTAGSVPLPDSVRRSLEAVSAF